MPATLAETEARLEESIDNWLATFDAIREAVLVVDRDGRIERANAAAAALLGARFPLIGASMLGSAPTEPMLAARRLVADVIRGGRERSVKQFRRPPAFPSAVSSCAT